jgi:hypothetical protein
MRLYFQPRIPQLKAHPQLLALTHRPHRLHSNTFVIQIADDAAIRLVQRDVGQCAEFVPVLGPCWAHG